MEKLALDIVDNIIKKLKYRYGLAFGGTTGLAALLALKNSRHSYDASNALERMGNIAVQSSNSIGNLVRETAANNNTRAEAFSRLQESFQKKDQDLQNLYHLIHQAETHNPSRAELIQAADRMKNMSIDDLNQSIEFDVSHSLGL